jgi:hypothetical protein
VLPDPIRHVDLVGNVHELYGAEREVVLVPLPIPRSVGAFGLWPTAGEREDKALTPTALIVADVRNDPRPGPVRGGRIPSDVINVLGHAATIAARADTGARAERLLRALGDSRFACTVLAMTKRIESTLSR